MMSTNFLIFIRHSMIWWITAMLVPIEQIYDAVDDEIERREQRALRRRL